MTLKNSMALLALLVVWPAAAALGLLRSQARKQLTKAVAIQGAVSLP